MNLRILGNTKLKMDATCPYCKGVGKKRGQMVEILRDGDNGPQFASFICENCREHVTLQG